jgi:hypothetical protein
MPPETHLYSFRNFIPRSVMTAYLFRALTFSALALSFIASNTFIACTTDGPDEDGNDSSAISLEVRHVHFAEPGQEAEIVDDLPETLSILLNGIPGNFFGTPTEDTLLVKTVPKSGSFRIPLDTLADFPASTRPAPYGPAPLEFGSVSPASVGIMRIGTFAEGGTGGSVLTDSVYEGYGIYDLSLKTLVSMIYFTGAARILADYELCDSSRFKIDISIPGKGFYFLYQKTEGTTSSVSLAPSAANRVFSVITMSQDYEDYFWTLNESQRGCFSDPAKTGTAPSLPSALRFWMARP